MAKYKEYDYSQGKFIPINFDKQILPGTFEHTLHYLIDNDVDLSVFDLRYSNDEPGRSGRTSFVKPDDFMREH
jgi:hypothetical protein